ncbi:MAG: multidrug MFS transporter [Anaerolinea sp.]|nr:multidrug MFS transporter [Anaerolinea sp.]
MEIRPYRIDVAPSVLDDLNRRLDATRWPAQLEDAGWDYGANLDYIRALCAYWRNGYDWRAHEAAINAHPQFLCEVDGVDIHFIHVRGKGSNPFPLVLIHGWPGSIVEFLDLIGPLTDPAAYGADPANSFDLVIPALPGFGFGGKPRDRGWGITRIAAAFDTLMSEALGYQRYGVQGGDWGGITAAKMGSAHAGHVAAIHLNFVIAQPPPGDLTAEEQAHAAKAAAFQAQETGYSNVQGTRPDSLTLAQSDSPAGLAAWIIEKFRVWSDCDGDVEKAFTRDALLTNLMFYWAPNSAASAARIYYEARNDATSFRYPKVEVPTGVAAFPKEPWNAPRRWAEQRYNIQHWTEMPAGGHFAAMERPKLLLDDIRAFFKTIR